MTDPGNGAGRRPRRASLAREIAVVLAVKVLALGLIWYAFFSTPTARQLDAGGVAHALLQAPSQDAQSQEDDRARSRSR